MALSLSKKEILWTLGTGGVIYSTPALSGETIYVGSIDGHVYALEALTGKLLWEIKTGGKITASPAVADGIVYVGSHDGKFYAIEYS